MRGKMAGWKGERGGEVLDDIFIPFSLSGEL